MLYIFKGSAASLQAHDTATEWHKGDKKPSLNGYSYTFQADGDELNVILEAIFKNSVKDLLDVAWDYRNDKIRLIKELRTRFVGMGLMEAKIFAEGLIDKTEYNHGVQPTKRY